MTIVKCDRCKEKAPDFVMHRGLCFECEEKDKAKKEKENLYPKW
jgi:hypothetical protein